MFVTRKAMDHGLVGSDGPTNSHVIRGQNVTSAAAKPIAATAALVTFLVIDQCALDCFRGADWDFGAVGSFRFFDFGIYISGP